MSEVHIPLGHSFTPCHVSQEAVCFHVLEADPNETAAEEKVQEELSFAERLLQQGRVAKAARMSSSKYRSTEHVSSTTNIIKQFFSGCKLVMTEKGKNMDHDTLDMVMFLKLNRSL